MSNIILQRRGEIETMLEHEQGGCVVESNGKTKLVNSYPEAEKFFDENE